MIGTINIEVQAYNPSMPLFSMRAFQNSPSSIRVRNVPKKIGTWQITKIYFTAEYPDNTIQQVECKLVGGVWVGTIEGSTRAGYVENGYTISADGIDENGNNVVGYVLGKGDIKILKSSSSIQPSDVMYDMHLLSAQSANPKDGDVWQDNGSWYIWQDGQAWPIGDDSGLIQQISSELSSKADTAGLSAYALSIDVQNELAQKQDNLTDAEKYALSDSVDMLATKFLFTDNSVSSFSWNKEEITFDDFAEAGLVDEATSAWVKQPRAIQVGKPVTYFYQNAFADCTSLTSIVFNDKVFVSSNRYYPWGASASIIQPFYNASQYWVQQQGYSTTYAYNQLFILPFGVRTVTLQPYKVNYLTFTAQQASFRVDIGGSAGNMRDMYFVFTVPSDGQPMTWNAAIDLFEGYTALTSGTNIYHIYEYASGHFAVEKFKGYDQGFTDIENTLNPIENTYWQFRSDVNNIIPSAASLDNKLVTSADISSFVTSSDVTAIVTATEGWKVTPSTYDSRPLFVQEVASGQYVLYTYAPDSTDLMTASDTIISTTPLVYGTTLVWGASNNITGSQVTAVYLGQLNKLGLATYDQLSSATKFNPFAVGWQVHLSGSYDAVYCCKLMAAVPKGSANTFSFYGTLLSSDAQILSDYNELYYFTLQIDANAGYSLTSLVDGAAFNTAIQDTNLYFSDAWSYHAGQVPKDTSFGFSYAKFDVVK